MNSFSTIEVKPTIRPQAVASNVTGATVDARGYDQFAVSIVTGTITDGSHALTLQGSADGSTWADVPASDLSSALPTIVAADDNKQWLVRVARGKYNYLRVNAAVTGATTGGVYSVNILLDKPRHY